ncbi:hypothetical protein MAN_00049, partial [Metarhizium hybridum]
MVVHVAVRPSQLLAKGAARPQHGAPADKGKRDRGQEHAQPPQQRAGPAGPQVLVQRIRRQRDDDGGQHVAREDARGEGRRAVDAVDVGQIVVERHKGQVDADAQGDARQRRHNPGDTRPSGPAQPELGEGEKGPSDARERQPPVLLLQGPGLAPVGAAFVKPVPGDKDGDGQHGADARRDEHEGRDAVRHGVRAAEDDGVRPEVEEEDDVLVEDEEVGEEDERLREETNRAGEDPRLFPKVEGWCFASGRGARRTVRDIPDAASLEDGREGLGHGQQHGPVDAGEDEGAPKLPLPDPRRREARDDGPAEGAYVAREAQQRHGQPARPEVGVDVAEEPSRDGLGRRRAAPQHEPEEEERRPVGCQRASQRKRRVHGKGNQKGRPAPPGLGHGGKDDGAKDCVDVRFRSSGLGTGFRRRDLL